MDKVKELLNRVLEWWNRFTSKQKTIIIGVASASIFAFAILIWVFTQPKYEIFQRCETTSEAAEITELLEAASIPSNVTSDGLTISIRTRDFSTARMALGSAGIPANGLTIDDVTSGGFSMTETDRQRRYKVFLEEQLRTDLESLEAVRGVRGVSLDIAEDNGTLIAMKQESSATVILELDGEFTQEQAASVARYVATSLGNETTNNITILDTKSNLLFSGESGQSIGGISSSQLTVRQQAVSNVESAIKKVLYGTNLFNSIEVTCNLDMDFSTQTNSSIEYSAPDGRDEGMIVNESRYNAESEGSSGGVPGTDSNGEDSPTYQFEDQENSSSTESEEEITRVPNSYESLTEIPAGAINFANSSASISACELTVVREEDVRSQGLLEGLTWDEYKAANSERVQIEVSDDLYRLIATASGMPEESITVLAFRENYFVDAEGLQIDWTDVISVVLIVLILGLLAFVIFRSMRGETTGVEAEELSVESLLQSTPEPELEEIEVDAKSEKRKVIEKFIDDNPEAAASLLRNWLNEDWG